jgi:hypothetical protein
MAVIIKINGDCFVKRVPVSILHQIPQHFIMQFDAFFPGRIENIKTMM